LNNRVLIIGALGQLGGVFVDALLENGDFVLASDIHTPTPGQLNCDYVFLDALNTRKIKKTILKYMISALLLIRELQIWGLVGLKKVLVLVVFSEIVLKFYFRICH